MFFIKSLLLILVIVISSLIGNIKANSFEKRYVELKKFKNALGIFKSKLEFTYEPINEIFAYISKTIYGDKDNIFKNYVENEDWNSAIDKQEAFTLEDKEVVKILGKMLGKLDKTGQLNEICLVDGFLDKQINNAFELKQKNKRLYKVLGRSIGLAIAIVLI